MQSPQSLEEERFLEGSDDDDDGEMVEGPCPIGPCTGLATYRRLGMRRWGIKCSESEHRATFPHDHFLTTTKLS